MYVMETVQVNTPLDGGKQTDSVSTSSVVFSRDELEDQLYGEATIHGAAGWHVRRTGNVVVVAMLRDVALIVRVIYAVEVDPSKDGDPSALLGPVL